MLESPDDKLSTPQNLISPLPSPALQNVSTEISIRTRGVHARLNKLIIARLPFALPPHSDSPELFAHGIDAFAEIYFAFETQWSRLIAQEKTGEPLISKLDEDIQHFLVNLVPSGLWRTEAIKADLRHLSKSLCIELKGVDGVRTEDTSLFEHIQKVTTERPHTLIAYAWIMYMAIFSGGRWIRQQLLQPGLSFWHVSGDTGDPKFGDSQNPVPGFSLFYFEGEKDGEDVKADFKARLEMAEALLSEKERREVTEEAHVIFDMCIGLVDKLDNELATPSGVADVNNAAVYAKAKAAHKLEEIESGSTRQSTTLLAVLLACMIWYLWRWLGSC